MFPEVNKFQSRNEEKEEKLVNSYKQAFMNPV